MYSKQKNLYKSKITLTVVSYGDFPNFVYSANTIKWKHEMKKRLKKIIFTHHIMYYCKTMHNRFLELLL